MNTNMSQLTWKLGIEAIIALYLHIEYQYYL